MRMPPWLETLRPKQWTKNLVLFAAIVFSERGLITQPRAWLLSVAAFLIFCALSGCVYLLNDLVDIEKDRLHPEKCRRPLASGSLPVRQAKAMLVALLVFCMGASWCLPPVFMASTAGYFLLNLAYSFWLKHQVILDVLTIAIGFVLRAMAGVGAMQAIDSLVRMSHWLVLCTLMLALFLALAKRRGEIWRMRSEASSHRRILDEYSLHFLDEMTAVSGATTIIGYALYTVSAETIARIGSDRLIFTVPFVIYGVFRYLYLIHIRNQGENPSAVFLRDRPMQINLMLWVMTVILLIHGI